MENISYFIIETIKKSESKSIFKVTDGEKIYMQKEFADDKREVYSLLKAKGFRGVPKIYSVQLKDSTRIVEEYIEGESLFEMIKSEKKITLKEAKRIALETASIIAQIHSTGIILRDIKPSNIVISNKGEIYIVDFDIARLHKPYSDKDTCLLGTVGYAPPEQFGFSSTDFKSDIYSYGMTMKDLFFFIKKPGQYKKIIEKCIEFDPKKRYSDMKKVIFMLKARKLLLSLALFFSACLLVFSLFQFAGFDASDTKDQYKEEIKETSTILSEKVESEKESFKSNNQESKSTNYHSEDATQHKGDNKETIASVDSPQITQPNISQNAEDISDDLHSKEEDFSPPDTCFYCNNPSVTFFGDRRFCNEHTPKCTNCGKYLLSGQSGLCEECTFSKIDNIIS